MKTHRLPGRAVVRKVFLVVMLVVLALQGLGINGLAAPATWTQYSQDGGGITALSCSAPIHRNAQVVLMIDDSGSMIATNDRGFSRNEGAKRVVDVLSDKLNTLQNGQQSPDVKMAVLHFSYYLKAPWAIRQLNQDRENVYSDIDLNKKFKYSLEKTDFVRLFERAAGLWKPEAMPATDDNTLRLIFLFTDGTPDYGKGPLKDNELKLHINNIAKKVLQLPRVNTIYYIAYKGSYRDLEDIKTHWDNEKDIHPELPSIEVFTADDFKNQLEKEITTAWVEQKIAVKLDSQPIQAQIGKPTNIVFQLVDNGSSDNRVISSEGLPPGYKLNEVSVTSGSQIIPVTSDDPNYQFSWTPQSANDDNVNIVASFVNDKGNKFDCSGTLKLQFVTEIITETVTPTFTGTATSTPGTPITNTSTPTFTSTVTSTSGTPVTDTSTPTSTSTGTTVTETFTPTPVITDTPTPNGITPPPPGPLALSLIIMPPRLDCSEKPQSIVLPMKLNSDTVKLDSEEGLVNPEWYKTAQGVSDDRVFGDAYTPVIEPVDAKNGEYNLIIEPIEDAEEIKVAVSALVKVNGQSIKIPEATGVIAAVPPLDPLCRPDGCLNRADWNIWFWPLLIGLVGLMIILLVLRSGSRRDEAENQASNLDIFRGRDWHLLFWPLLVLLILLVLVQVVDDWACIVPPWLFLISILLWMILVLLIRFLPGHDDTRPRPWWLLILLLALGFLGYLAITIPGFSLLWLLLVLLLAWVILWYLKPDGPPDPTPNPNPVPPFDFQLVIGPATELLNSSMTVPVQVISKGNASGESSLQWDVRDWNVIATSPGKDLAQNLDRNTVERGAGILTISDIDDNVNTVMVEARAEVGVGDQGISTLQAAATIQVVRVQDGFWFVDHRVAILNMEAPGSCVPYNQEIAIPLHFEYQGKEILVPPLIWTPSVRLSPAGQVGARVEQEGSGEYKLIIDPVQYDKENPATEMHVQVHAEAKLSNGRSIAALGGTTIQICPPDDLTELEGIGKEVQDLLYANNIFTFEQLAQADHKIINGWLNLAGWKMMDSKTWPQQAKLAAIAREYGKEDKENYEAYKAWLKDGIEPDEHDKDEKDRRPSALVWNQISQFTPVILRLALNPERVFGAIILPMHLKYEGDGTWLSAVEWEVTTLDMDSGKRVGTEITPIQGVSGRYELRIEPDPGVKEIQLIAQAQINGRSVEIYDPASRVEIYLSRDVIMVPIPPPTPMAKDDLTELEGVGQATEKILNARGIITFQQLAEANMDDITTWLNDADLKMLDPKTWPQQAKLADIARRYGREADRQNYEAYKAWLRNGIEPDEYDKDEKERRTDGALVWNRIAECTPVVLSLVLGPSSAQYREATILPLQLNREADRVRLSMVEWQVSARTMPGGNEVQALIRSLNETLGTYELVIDPIQDEDAREVQVTVQALVNGRSIEIYYGKAITVQVSPPPAADDLTGLEGIGKATEKVLNENGIFTFRQLARANKDEVTAWLNAGGLKMIDPKTWPQQAKLADIANKYGREEDRQSYEAYKAWLKGGIEPDEYDKDEKDRRPVALVWPLAPDSIPDPLEELEGIGKDIARVLNDKGIFTFKQLARTDVRNIQAWLDECGYQRMDPKTWPQQAKLAGIAKEFGTEDDRRSYESYKAWLKGGIEPDEYKKDEKDRRRVALVWHGNAELTEKAYPEIFKL